MSAAIKTRPIIFSDPMVRAIFEDRKTETRRLVRRQHFSDAFHARCPAVGVAAALKEFGWRCPYGDVDDRLWVREAFFCNDYRYPEGPADEMLAAVIYREDCTDINGIVEDSEEGPFKWTSPIFMPRWASRLTLDITNIRLERLHEIDDAGAHAEGIDVFAHSYRKGAVADDETLSVRDAYRIGWDELNAKRGHAWITNPWVWVIEFAVVLP